ncbi:6-pyruvoyltetrahydropterin synthase [Heterostelium album PN500]|uniref:6-pyruvoyl tetrahydrobiopterin synthase n=1 Tax=Heterostelium pallidum (strain ATCC 26659 / Pp 5 / PN500) TaxID=670386 RepID=D3BJ97_HETP5|nr:6-pyruvoyltetrahydropterin synthase [Heterostelium album PN500]EFA77977.1 6-pyruvoyltetrahydropterin synthase [Heterostelium album PN500]|eukprot:XP_020430105.1 6-pyruvoyltetrahydropterin synthase [Heterostelium album PN500]
MASKVVILTRREVFSASHRLYSEHLTEEENKATYGKCINQHGHNYTLEVSVRGKLNEKTGMFINATELKQIIKEEIMDRMDHKNLEVDVKEFQGVVTTTENLCVVIYELLAKRLGELLYEVKILETENNYVIYRGDSS